VTGQNRCLVERQRRQVDRLIPTLALERRETFTQRVSGPNVDVPVNTEDESPGRLERAGQVLQQVQSRRVRPLKIIQDDHQGML
jgi:hypothetical protein